MAEGQGVDHSEDELDLNWNPLAEDPEVPDENDANDRLFLTKKLAVVDNDWSTLNGQKLPHWQNGARAFCDKVIQVEFDRVMRVSVEDQKVQVFLSELNDALGKLGKDKTRSAASARSVLPAVLSGSAQYLNAIPEERRKWSPVEIWCLFIARLHVHFVQNPNGLLSSRHLGDDEAAYTCVWILAHIIVTKNKPDIKAKTINGIQRRKRQGDINAKALKIAGGTISTKDSEAKFVETRDALLVKEGLKKVSRAAPKDKAKSTETVKGQSKGKAKAGSTSGEADYQKNPADGDVDMDDAPEELDDIAALPESEIQENYLQTQNRTMRSTGDEEAAKRREELAARTLGDMMASLKRKKNSAALYNCIVKLLYHTAIALKDDFRETKQAIKPIMHPVIKHIKAAHESGASLTSGELTQPNDEELVHDLIRTEDLQKTLSAKEDTVVELVSSFMTLERVTDDEIAETRKWEAGQNSTMFGSTALKEAMLSLRILDLVKKLLPNTTVALNWWQVTGAKWLRDLPFGGMLADIMGLGKTLTAAAVVADTANDFHANLLEPDSVPDDPASDATSDDDKKLARPSMYVTLAPLVVQTAREIAQFGTKLRVIVLGKSGVGMKREPFECMESIDDTHPIWDTKNAENVNVVFVVSINWWCDKFGPTAFWQWAQAHSQEYMDLVHGGEPFGNRKWANEKKDRGAPVTSPIGFPQAWVRGRVNILIIDECQLLVRNVNNYWKSMKWIEAKKVILLSGYPAPRGMVDFTSYLRLVFPSSHTLLSKHFGAHRVDVYKLPDDHALARYRTEWTIFDHYIAKNDKLTEIDRARKAQKTLSTFVLRRDYTSALPSGSENTIGRSMVAKRHFTIEAVFSPSQKRCYDRYSGKWRPRMMTMREGADGVNQATPNSRASRAFEIIEFIPITGSLHLVSEVLKRPKWLRPNQTGWDDLLFNRDRLSWFFDDSPMSKRYEATILDAQKAGQRGARLRWVFKECFTRKCVEFRDVNYDINKLGDDQLVELFCKWSPKTVAVLGFIADFVFVRQEKVIIWVMTPEIQDFLAEIFELLTLSFYVVNAATPSARRDQIQAAWNDPSSRKTKILLAAGRVCGTGFNLHKASRAALVVDTPDTEQVEAQLLSRQYRGGQTETVLFFVLTMAEGRGGARLQTNLATSLAGTAVFATYASPDIDPDAPPEHVERFREDWMTGFLREQKDPNGGGVLDHANYDYFHVLSTRGQSVVKQMRIDQDKDDDWYPTTLSVDYTIEALSSQRKTKTMSQICGVPVASSDYKEVLDEELRVRKIKRVEAAGIDSDADDLDKSKVKPLDRVDELGLSSEAESLAVARLIKLFGASSFLDLAIRVAEETYDDTDGEDGVTRKRKKRARSEELETPTPRKSSKKGKEKATSPSDPAMSSPLGHPFGLSMPGGFGLGYPNPPNGQPQPVFPPGGSLPPLPDSLPPLNPSPRKPLLSFKPLRPGGASVGPAGASVDNNDAHLAEGHFSSTNSVLSDEPLNGYEEDEFGDDKDEKDDEYKHPEEEENPDEDEKRHPTSFAEVADEVDLIRVCCTLERGPDYDEWNLFTRTQKIAFKKVILQDFDDAWVAPRKPMTKKA